MSVAHGARLAGQRARAAQRARARRLPFAGERGRSAGETGIDAVVIDRSGSGRWAGATQGFDEHLSYRENKEQWENEFEKRYLTWLMQRAQGNISRAAREADMDRKYLHKLLKKHAIVT